MFPDYAPTQRADEQGDAGETAEPDGGEALPEDIGMDVIEAMPEEADEVPLEEDTQDDSVSDAVPDSVEEEIAEVAEMPEVEVTVEAVEEPPATTPIIVTERPPTEAIKIPELEDAEGDLDHENLMPDEQETEGRLPM